MSNEAMDNFQFLAENSVDILCRVDLKRVMQYVSPASERVLGWRPEEMLGRTSDSFVLAEDLPVLEAAARRGMLPETENAPTRLRIRRKDGTFAWVETNARPVRDDAGRTEGFVLVMRDVTQQQRMEEALGSLARTDPLTGLANRRAFDEVLAREWSRALRESGQISLLLLDVDRFKDLKDRYGAQTGDDCLRAVSAAVLSAVRASDIVARYGGEELAVILPHAEAAGAMRVAEQVRASVQGLRLPHAGNAEHGSLVTVSVGAATAVGRGDGSMRMPESLLLAADNALYKAKHEGRNRVATSLLAACQQNAGPGSSVGLA